jgi:hypothetical protein
MKEAAREPLRGDAAWRANKAEIAKRNEAACADARAQRAERDAQAMEYKRAAARRERAGLPSQPHH